MNLGLAVTFKIFKLILVFGNSFLPNSVQQTQIKVSTKMHTFHTIQFVTYNKYFVHAVTSAVIYLPNRS